MRQRVFLLLSFLLVSATLFVCERALVTTGRDGGNDDNANHGILPIMGSRTIDDYSVHKERRILVRRSTSPPPTAMVYQAESATVMDNAEVDSDEEGYTDGGYVDYDKYGYVEWRNVQAFLGAGEYRLDVRYAVADKAGRECLLFVNDMDQEVATLEFPHTGGYGVWRYESVTVPLLGGMNNVVRIEAVTNGGPHVDRMDVTLVSLHTPRPTSAPTARPSVSPTASAPPSNAPSLSSPPSSSSVPSPRPTYPDIGTSPERPFQLKMFFEEGMEWQEESETRAWCAECTTCRRGERLEVRECDEEEMYQRWTYEGGRLRSAVERGLCLQSRLPRSTQAWMEPCGGGDDNERDRAVGGGGTGTTVDDQIFVGVRRSGKFQLKPLRHQTRCLTQGHHPKSGESLLLEDCNVSLVGDGTMLDPYDDTSHWVIGTWTGHSDDGEHYPELPVARNP